MGIWAFSIQIIIVSFDCCAFRVGRLRLVGKNQVMNLSHIVHEFSFGPFFPAIAQPLDQSYEITEQRKLIFFSPSPFPLPHPIEQICLTHTWYILYTLAFTIFQYFLRVVPTTYIDASRRKLITSQYAVTDYSRSFEHGKGVPGLFFKYDLEPMSVVIRERTTSLYQFLIRLAGVVGQSRKKLVVVFGFIADKNN